MTRRVCLHSDCDKRLQSNNASGWCQAHRSSGERRANDAEYRERANSYARLQYQTNADYRARHNTRVRERRSRYTDDYRAKQSARLRERRATDPDYRERSNAKGRERYHRLGGKGYQRNRRALDGKQANLCALCGDRMYDDVTVDHIVPVSDGGGHEIENLQAVHRGCNSRKKDGYDIFAVNGVIP